MGVISGDHHLSVTDYMRSHNEQTTALPSESRSPESGPTPSRWRSALSRAVAETLDTLYPLTCLGGQSSGNAICAECRATMPRLRPPYCDVCARPGATGTCRWCRSKVPAIDRIAAAYLDIDTSPIHDAITLLKFGNLRAVAPEMAELLTSFLNARSIAADVIVPVPSHPRRLRARGFNQAALIGVELGNRIDLSVAQDVLIRTRDARSQLLSPNREDRWLNVEGSFACGNELAGKRVMLVDDLVTTGATMSACATALKQAGVSTVVGLAVARAP
jgi:ComF family protein|tara:strand:- start:4062 stop:4886 length:825 start_codon:yes stop_codon:yes gene_type:complete